MVKIFLPILLLILIFPVGLIFFNNQDSETKIQQLKLEQETLQEELQEMESVENEITEVQSRISVFSDLLGNSYKRIINIKNIEQYIPSEIAYTKISLLFSDYNSLLAKKTSEETEEVEESEEIEVKIYENIPNIMVIEGKTKKLDAISRFVYKLNQDPLMEVVNVDEIGWLEEEKINSFIIIVEVKEAILK